MGSQIQNERHATKVNINVRCDQRPIHQTSKTNVHKSVIGSHSFIHAKYSQVYNGTLDGTMLLFRSGVVHARLLLGVFEPMNYFTMWSSR